MNGDGSSVGVDGGVEAGVESAGVHPRYGSEPADGIDESEVFHVLGNDRRREIIGTLIDGDEALSVSDLAQRIASEEVEEGDEPSKNLYKSVYVSLQQTHLPKLAETRIVVYDTDTQYVKPGPAFSQVRPYLRETNQEVSPLRSTVPLLLSGLGLLVALGLTVDIPALQGVGTAMVGTIFLLLIVVLVVSRSQTSS